MKREQGFVLISVFVVVLLCSMLAISLMFRLRAEQTAATASISSEQAWAAAMSGIQEAFRIIAASTPDNPLWQEAPEFFLERLVIDDGADRWYFTVYSHDPDELDLPRYGLTDEAAKLNLNFAAEEMLAAIPGLTTEMVHALLDYVDWDDLPREHGAEQDYYDGLETPYSIRNGPMQTLGELLLVRGFTPSLVYGREGQRRSGISLESASSLSRTGLRQYLTVWSYDSNRDADGEYRLDLNDPETALDATGLPDEVIEFIQALWAGEVWLDHPSELLGLRLRTRNEDGAEVEMESGVGKEELAILLDRCTAAFADRLPGLINLNTAPPAVLQALPGVDEALAEAIAVARRDLNPEQLRTPAWLYEEDLVSAGTFRSLAPYLTARSQQFSFRVIGYGIPSGRYRVLEVVVDGAAAAPAILYLRDITRLGPPFSIQESTEVVRG
jgi:hypothetical protein